MSETPKCDVHPDTALICPRCIAAKGGRRRKELAKTPAGKKKIRNWGKAGGRPSEKGGPK